ncbi:peptide chain release factor H [Duganella sp. FT80W]|uniref:Peptide chain release factor H n=1 Tax=Duganella guangzhouensis TaxID=2666084 RepID=A0A6I2L1I3_9BURK|nr:peptide chain release factor H [Duganella guangzhouensis]MRW91712.1 peptide chain release factor H [Duganella guangzhouensis]
MIVLQLSANSGPAECCLGVQHALRRLFEEAEASAVHIELLEQEPGPVNGTLRSVLLQLEGQAASVLAQRWSGSILWVCQSPYRIQHKRKNWFLQGSVFRCADALPTEGEIRYEAIRASGPGGQHVNKTDSAIRATHMATGISVKVQSQRSQHANKRLAAQLLSIKLAELVEGERERQRQLRHRQHRLAERGNAQRIFMGSHFAERLES